MGSREKRDVENGLRIGVPRDECLVRGAGTALWAGCWVGTSPAGKMWLLVRAERGGRRDGEEAKIDRDVFFSCQGLPYVCGVEVAALASTGQRLHARP